MGSTKKVPTTSIVHARSANEQTVAVMVSGIRGEETGGTYYNRLPNKKPSLQYYNNKNI